MVSDANDIGWGGHNMQGVVGHAHEYFSKHEGVETSTYWELLGVYRCLHAMICMCDGKLLVHPGRSDAESRDLLAIGGALRVALS